MKIFVTFLLLGVFTVGAQEITKKVFERRNPDGTLRTRIETTSRGKIPIFQVYQTFNAGKATMGRSYMVGGEIVMTESDDDGDGVFETMLVYRPATSEMEVFTRAKDGSITPVSAQTLAAYKKQHAAIDELWDGAFENDPDGDKFLNRARDARRKILEAEQEKKNKKD